MADSIKLNKTSKRSKDIGSVRNYRKSNFHLPKGNSYTSNSGVN